MEQKTKHKSEFKSYEEYRESYFPISSKEQIFQFDDPRLFGTSLARESLNKFKHLLVKQ